MTFVAPAIGIILPSSNRVVERVTHAILADHPRVDVCFTRVPYSGHPSDGYDLEPFRRAAAMLAEARPRVILWNATRGALLGFEPDRRLCAMIESETGISADTTALSTVALLRSQGLKRIGLLAQGGEEEGARLKATFSSEGVEITHGCNLGISDNFEAARVSTEDIEEKVTRLASTGDLDAVLIWSTNLAGHAVADRLTRRLKLPVLDSATIGAMRAFAYAAGSHDPRFSSSVIA